MRSRVCRAAFGVVSLALVAVLGACGPVKMGAAAVVGDQRISASSIDQSAREVGRIAPAAAEQGNVPGGLTLSRVVDLLVKELAEREGVTYSQGDVDDAIADATQDEGLQENQVYSVPLVIGVKVQMPTADAKRFGATLYLQDVLIKRYGGSDQEAGQKQLTRRLSEVAREIGVEVNPRYGDFDENTVNLRVTYGGLWVPSARLRG